MPKPTKTQLKKYRAVLAHQLAVLSGNIGALRDEALGSPGQVSTGENMADLGSDNYDQSFLLGLSETEEGMVQRIRSALDRIDGETEFAFGLCRFCKQEAEALKAKKSKKKIDPWIGKARLEFLPWAEHCVRHQAELEQNRDIA